jgi:S-DNA-T family DNA segregation ATPase FtsK/SpoIIIE
MRTTSSLTAFGRIPYPLRAFVVRRAAEILGVCLVVLVVATAAALLTWSVEDPSFNHATSGPVRNWLGWRGAVAADLLMQMLGIAAVTLLIPPGSWGWQLLTRHGLDRLGTRLPSWVLGAVATAGLASMLPSTDRWPLPSGLGGVIGDALLVLPDRLFGGYGAGMLLVAVALGLAAVASFSGAFGATDLDGSGDDGTEETGPARRGGGPGDGDRAVAPGRAFLLIRAAVAAVRSLRNALAARVAVLRAPPEPRREPAPWYSTDEDSRLFETPIDLAATPMRLPEPEPEDLAGFDAAAYAPPATRAAAAQRRRAEVPAVAASRTPEPSILRRVVAPVTAALKPSRRAQEGAGEAGQGPSGRGIYRLPPLGMLAEPRKPAGHRPSEDALGENARLLEGVLEDFGVKGEIINVRPGPVVTLYELEPAPGIKSSRVIGLADDIARSMSAISARVAVVQGRNAIGIELPNQTRETVFLRELLGSEDFEHTKHKLAIALGKTIGGEPIIVDLARMPHLLVAGTTGSGKSVAINTMILSLLYRLKPDECRLIMVDPKMLELSVYDGIPHLLTPVVTDPKKAVVALKWAVREMEDRYKKMSKLGVRNIEGFNVRVAEASARGEILTRTVQTGYDRETGEAVYEQEQMELSLLPFIVVIVDEMADLMMVAGKDIEGAIQRLAQMARAAGIHLIMATQRPSVDVITGTIKANFPTRISFQVTSKIDSRTILGEQGAEQLLGQGDMLYMAGGGRISRVHGPFVSDHEVEQIVAHLKAQGRPDYLDAITSEDDASDDADEESAAPGSMDSEEAGDLYDRAVAIVLRDRKCSTSYIQRRLSVGYNKAASLVERMEEEGVVGAPNHSGKRAILVGGGIDRGAFDLAAEG